MGIIKSKQELEERKKFYKKIYSNEINSYYDSLINLEISALDNSQIDERIISELSTSDFYNDVARFNIYNQAKNKLVNDSKLKRTFNTKDILDMYYQSKIEDYKVYYYNPYKDEVCLYDLNIDRSYRKKKINDIEKNRIDILDREISSLSIDKPEDRYKEEQLLQTKEIALLEIKSLKNRIHNEEYAKEVRDIINEYTSYFEDLYNADDIIRVKRIGNTKIYKQNYHY